MCDAFFSFERITPEEYNNLDSNDGDIKINDGKKELEFLHSRTYKTKEEKKQISKNNKKIEKIIKSTKIPKLNN